MCTERDGERDECGLTTTRCHWNECSRLSSRMIWSLRLKPFVCFTYEDDRVP